MTMLQTIQNVGYVWLYLAIIVAGFSIMEFATLKKTGQNGTITQHDLLIWAIRTGIVGICASIAMLLSMRPVLERGAEASEAYGFLVLFVTFIGAVVGELLNMFFAWLAGEE